MIKIEILLDLLQCFRILGYLDKFKIINVNHCYMLPFWQNTSLMLKLIAVVLKIKIIIHF